MQDKNDITHDCKSTRLIWSVRERGVKKPNYQTAITDSHSCCDKVNVYCRNFYPAEEEKENPIENFCTILRTAFRNDKVQVLQSINF